MKTEKALSYLLFSHNCPDSCSQQDDEDNEKEGEELKTKQCSA